MNIRTIMVWLRLTIFLVLIVNILLLVRFVFFNPHFVMYSDSMVKGINESNDINEVKDRANELGYHLNRAHKKVTSFTGNLLCYIVASTIINAVNLLAISQINKALLNRPGDAVRSGMRN